MIFNVQRFSTHDGSGIRTIIFYKGCPLRCDWCCNPESQSFGYSIIYDQKNCMDFGDCLQASSQAIVRSENNKIDIRRDRLLNPLEIKDLCASRSITLAGEAKSVDELVGEIEKDTPFYRDEGGVTLSGGEPLSQGDDLISLLNKLKARNINVNMETSLHVDWEKVARCIGLVDTFLVDLKHTDKAKFEVFVQGDARIVLDNLERLINSGGQVIVRIPVIPGFNHTESEIFGMIDYVDSLEAVDEIHFLPYHTFGVGKYKMLGMDYPYDSRNQVNDSELEPYVLYAQSKGITTKIGG